MIDFPLGDAATAGDTQTVLRLLDEEQRIDGRIDSYSGNLGLLFAARGGHTQTALAFLQNGIDVNGAEDRQGWTALHTAASNGHLQTAQMLIRHGANVNFIDKHGISAFAVAVANGHMEMARFLLNNGAHLHPEDGTAIVLAAERSKEAVSLLLEVGVDINYTSGYSTALIQATIKNRTDIVEFLLRVCYALFAAVATNLASISMTKATKCKPATVSGNRS